jgi:uncharacterized protein (DUF1501 family)
MAMLSLGFAPSFLTRAAEAATGRRRLLIAIFQRGAVDGLNMVIPYGEADYYALRPSIAIPKPGTPNGGAIDLDGFFALHPAMSALQPYWDNASLAVVHACGSPDTTRSHFDAQDYMENCDAGREEHARRMVEPISAGGARGTQSAARRRCHAPDAARAAGNSGGTGTERRGRFSGTRRHECWTLDRISVCGRCGAWRRGG